MLAVKICGINAPEAMASALEGGARYVGLVFYPPSPRHVSPQAAAALAAPVPEHVAKVGLFVDPTDAQLDATLAAVPLDLLQLHGEEKPARVREIRARLGLPVMKAIRLGGPEDIVLARSFIGTADRLLFDARAPEARPEGDDSGAAPLPGGNGQVFDWRLLAGTSWPLPWMLSGGLTVENLPAAIAATGAAAVDVSSGVEEVRGVKSPARIRAFLKAAAGL